MYDGPSPVNALNEDGPVFLLYESLFLKTTLSVFEIVHAGFLVDTEFISTVYLVDDGVVKKSSFN